MIIRWVCFICLATVNLPEVLAIAPGNTDTLRQRRFALGGTPTISYDPDLGFKLGAVINLFDYGDRKKYPDFYQFLNLRGYASTKGTSLLSVVFESDKCLSRSTLVAEASWIRDARLDFFGFNGGNATYTRGYVSPEDPDYINTVYYAYERVLTRLRAEVYTTLFESRWRSLLGVTYQHFALDDVDYNKLAPPQGPDGQPAEYTSLYKNYLDWGVITNEEASGGQVLSVLTGVSLDTRNNRIHCRKGMWFDNYLLTSLDMVPGRLFGKHITTFRHFVEIPRLFALFAYRLSSQQKVFGDIPFYAAPFFLDTRLNQDGYGGAATLRGVYRNRIVADGYLSGNFEWRQDLFRTRFLTLQWQVALSGFADIVYITSKHPVDLSRVPEDVRQVYFNDNNQRPVCSFGSGIYFIYNDNNVISATLGYSPDPQFGRMGIYIGSAFHF